MATSDTSSTPQAAAGGTTSDALSLGKKIIQTLRHDDLLAQWMAHLIAERMAALEHVPAEARQQAEDDVADLILRLWERGRNDAFDQDPVRLSASVSRAVAKLDPEPGEPYFRAFGFVSRPERTGTEMDEYLHVALSLDGEVGRLIRSLVTYAAAVAEDQEADWIQMLREVDADPLLLIRDLTNRTPDSEHDDDSDPMTARRERIARQAAAVCALLEPWARDAPPTSTSESRRRRLAARIDHTD